MARPLSPRHDAFGLALLDHLEGRDGSMTVERSDGLLDDSVGSRVYFAPYEEWRKLDQRTAALARGRVLDVGCGAGRLALHLQERGLDVVGIDNSPAAVDVCRRRGVRDARVLSIVDIGPALGTFDTVVFMGNNFGLFASAAGVRRLLPRFHRLTSPDGRLVAQVVDPYRTDEPVHLAYHEANRRAGRMAGQIRLRVRHGGLRTPWFDYLFVSLAELRELIQGSGWAVADVLASDEPVYIAVLAKT